MDVERLGDYYRYFAQPHKWLRTVKPPHAGFACVSPDSYYAATSGHDWACGRRVSPVIDPPTGAHDYCPPERPHFAGFPLRGEREEYMFSDRDREGPRMRFDGTAILEFNTAGQWSWAKAERVILACAYRRNERRIYQATGGTCCEDCGETANLVPLPGDAGAFLCPPCHGELRI
jgi:hypothetical protein